MNAGGDGYVLGEGAKAHCSVYINAYDWSATPSAARLTPTLLQEANSRDEAGRSMLTQLHDNYWLFQVCLLIDSPRICHLQTSIDPPPPPPLSPSPHTHQVFFTRLHGRWLVQDTSSAWCQTNMGRGFQVCRQSAARWLSRRMDTRKDV